MMCANFGHLASEVRQLDEAGADNRVDLYSREDAIAKGYKPYGRCNP